MECRFNICRWGPLTVLFGLSAWAGIAVYEHFLREPVWRFEKAWLMPYADPVRGIGPGIVENEILILNRNDIIRGTDITFCKRGKWTTLVHFAETVQNFIPLNSKGEPIVGDWKSAGVHLIRKPGRAVALNECRTDPTRLDTSLGVGDWGLRAESRFYVWYDPFWPVTTATIVARFRVIE